MIRTSVFLESISLHRHWLLLAVLVLLHLLLLQGTGMGDRLDSPIVGTLLVGHVGLFLLWQPMVSGEKQLGMRQLLLTAFIIAGAVVWLNWWLLMVWVMLFASIIGGKVFLSSARWMRLFYMLALTYLLLILLVLITPQVIPKNLTLAAEFDLAARYGLPLLFLIMAILPLKREAAGSAEVIDFVYSIFLFLLLAVLILGSLAFMLLRNANYLESLVYTMMAMAGVLLLLAWVWNPQAGFSGVGVLFSRYMLSIGLPFEQWLHKLADYSMREEQPEKFLERSFHAFAGLPWIEGGEWKTANGHGSFGSPTSQRSEYVQGPLRITLYSRHELSPALTWHFNLLAQLLGEFYVAKLRGERLQQMSYVQAIHETGARLTHDVKNLLQSLNALCFTADREDEEISPRHQALLRRQLPIITQRLQQTLDKLGRPGEETAQLSQAGIWWDNLRQRYAGENIDFAAAALVTDALIPPSLFNSVAENLIQNALQKKQLNPALRIKATLSTVSPIRLAVCDDGDVMATDTATLLFRAPVASASGLGIGLYQAARYAEANGYVLRVAANEPGNICLELVERTVGWC